MAATNSDFRRRAEERLRVLESREAERELRREERAREQLATQTAMRQQRERKLQAEAEKQAADARSALAAEHGQQTADRVVLSGSYWLSTCESRAVAVAISRPPGSASRDNWRATQRLQAALGVGVGVAEILQGVQLSEASSGLRLLVDPDVDELARLNPEPRTPR